MKFKFKKYENWFFSYQKLPFKWVEIKIGNYTYSNFVGLEQIEIIVQIAKIRLFFGYDRNES